MTIHLVAPQRSFETVRAIAASGSSGLARRAQAELKARQNASLAASLRQQPQNTPGRST